MSIGLEYEPNEVRSRFELPNAKPMYPRDINFRIINMKLQIAVHITERSIKGKVEYNLEKLDLVSLDEIVLDAKELDIEEVTCQGRQAKFEHVGGKLHISPGKIEGKKIDVGLKYSGRPEAGIYFVTPDDDHPARALQAWSQGEDEFSSYWFPCFDYPNMKYTTEIWITVAPGLIAVSNGRLLKTVEDRKSGMKTFVWGESAPHSSYLNSIAIGDFALIEDKWKSIPVQYYVQKGREEEARRSFHKTPKMIEHFSKLIGVDYPYEKYAQVAASEFIWGGMENISATTQTDETLHDERAETDFPSHGLVAHELAHQWFGDLLTTKDWSNVWLNEGFATYFDGLFREHDEGAEELEMFLYQQAENYFKEDAENYRRPVVQREYLIPTEMFDRTTYQKGALVLHMLRKELGDELFFRSINRYCQNNMYRSVETADFIRSIEDATGRNMQWFFDKWVFSAGYPDIRVEYEYSSKTKQVKLSFKQIQEIDDLTPVFNILMTVSIRSKDGKRKNTRIRLKEREEKFVFDVEDRPSFVSIDPHNEILKKLEYVRPHEDALNQLRTGEAFEKIQAALELSTVSAKKTVDALQAELKKDNFWGVHHACAYSLGRLNRKDALDALHSSLQVKDTRARKQVVAAIGNYRDSSSAEILRKCLEDRSYAVASEAVTAISKLYDYDAKPVLRKALGMSSHLDVIRQAALSAYGECGGEEDVVALKTYTHRRNSWRVRSAALRAIAMLGKDDRKVREFVYLQLKDENLRYRDAAIDAVRLTGNLDGVPELEHLIRTERDGRLKRKAYDAVESIRRKKPGNERELLKQEVNRLRGEVRELRYLAESLEAKMSGKRKK